MIRGLEASATKSSPVSAPENTLMEQSLYLVCSLILQLEKLLHSLGAEPKSSGPPMWYTSVLELSKIGSMLEALTGKHPTAMFVFVFTAPM